MLLASYKLPVSLLLTSLLLFAFSPASAAPPAATFKRPLTQDNFNSTISEGYWMVMFFSDRSRVNPSKLEEGFRRVVDCSVSEDLCYANGVVADPQMNLYRDGALVNKTPLGPDITYLPQNTPTRVLTQDDFNSTISRSAWYVEFSSPYPGYSRIHTSTWEKFARIDNVSFARVDCSVSGDLCDASGVEAYPQVNVYREGAFVTKYIGGIHTPVPNRGVAFLTPHNFTTTVAQDGTIAKGLWFVQYYAPGCYHCTEFAPTWEKLVEKSAGVQFARVDCDANRALCVANKIRRYPQLNVYRNGKFVETYDSSRDLSMLTNYLAALTPPSTSTLNTDGEVAVLTLHNFTTTLAQGPAFVNFYRAGCPHCGLPAPIWTQLAAMRGRITVAEMDCGQLFNHEFCSARLLRADSNLVYFPSDFASNGANAKVYPGPRTLEQLMAFVDVGGIYPPPAMELTRETLRTMMAAPIFVIATSGTDTTESIAARVSEIAHEWLLLHGPSGRTVQFAWQDWKYGDDMVGAPMDFDEDTDLHVQIMDHEAGPESRGYGDRGNGKVYLTEQSGEPLKLTAASIFPVLEAVAKPTDEMLSSAASGQIEEEASTDSVAEQAMRMQYPYRADAYIMAHPLKVLYWLSLMLGVVYLVLRRFLRAETEVRADDKGLE